MNASRRCQQSGEGVLALRVSVRGANIGMTLRASFLGMQRAWHTKGIRAAGPGQKSAIRPSQNVCSLLSAVLAVLALVPFLGCGQSGYRIQEQRLGRFHEQIVRRRDSPDRLHVAYIARRHRKEFVVLDGRGQRDYDLVDRDSLVFSRDGKRLAYAVKRNGRWFFVLDGREQAEYDEVWQVTFSPDSRHVAYIGTRWEGWRPVEHVVIDGQEGPTYKQIITSVPVFDSSGALEYLAVRDGTLYRVKHVPR